MKALQEEHVEFREETGQPHEVAALFASTGWTDVIQLEERKLHDAVSGSWKVLSAYRDGKLVGMGRLVSDGHFQAFLCDLIVLPEYRGKGIGSELLKRLLILCRDKQLLSVHLFSARGKSGFYAAHGFQPRPDDAPGMVWAVRDLF